LRAQPQQQGRPEEPPERELTQRDGPRGHRRRGVRLQCSFASARRARVRDRPARSIPKGPGGSPGARRLQLEYEVSQPCPCGWAHALYVGAILRQRLRFAPRLCRICRRKPLPRHWHAAHACGAALGAPQGARPELDHLSDASGRECTGNYPRQASPAAWRPRTIFPDCGALAQPLSTHRAVAASSPPASATPHRNARPRLAQGASRHRLRERCESPLCAVNGQHVGRKLQPDEHARRLDDPLLADPELNATGLITELAQLGRFAVTALGALAGELRGPAKGENGNVVLMSGRNPRLEENRRPGLRRSYESPT
jgi:hypothetical protein